MKAVPVLCVAALMAGCAGVYDPSLIAGAKATSDLEYDRCGARQTAGEIRTVSALLECFLTADRAFAATVKLRRMDLYEAYAARMRLLGSEIDRQAVTVAEAQQRYTAIRRDYFASLDAAYAADQAERAQASAAMMAFGAGLQGAGAAYQANQPPPPPAPITCRTAPATLGGTTARGSTTTCY